MRTLVALLSLVVIACSQPSSAPDSGSASAPAASAPTPLKPQTTGTTARVVEEIWTRAS